MARALQPTAQAAFDALAWATTSPLETPGAVRARSRRRSHRSVSPLDVSYPRVPPDGVDALMAAATAGMTHWRDAGIEARVGVGLEILARLHARVFELANAVHAHLRTGVRDGVPGRRGACARPGAGVDRLRVRAR